MQNESVSCDLVFIANFANFIQSYNFLEKRSETPVDTLQVFNKVMDNIQKITGVVGEDKKRKCDKLSRSLKSKNCNEYGFYGLLQICTSDLRRDRQHSLTSDNLVLYCLKIRALVITDTGVNEKYTMKQKLCASCLLLMVSDEIQFVSTQRNLQKLVYSGRCYTLKQTNRNDKCWICASGTRGCTGKLCTNLDATQVIRTGENVEGCGGVVGEEKKRKCDKTDNIV
ncbi:hypothetical protein T03_16257 [Trichinella britovi]|uniref:FLYWCH-type domain-containing protein n=1 Tax=Trichinella britovi TaxID=45882 RepID=A0A0V1C4V4_TRIBR|nr:hypothetical protein T03_16257 [Trichinella britovi]